MAETHADVITAAESPVAGKWRVHTNAGGTTMVFPVDDRAYGYCESHLDRTQVRFGGFNIAAASFNSPEINVLARTLGIPTP